MDMARRHVIQERWEAVWERSRTGRHTIVVGPHILPPAPPDLQVLRVRCDALRQQRWSPGGGPPCRQRTALVRAAGFDPGGPRAKSGLRQRLWGDMPAPSLDALLVEACNRLATPECGACCACL